MKKQKRIIRILVLIVVVGSFFGKSVTADAREIDYHLCEKNVTIEPKGCATLELTSYTSMGVKYAIGKIKWKVISGKKVAKIKKIKQDGMEAEVVGLKEGTAKVQVTHRKQKLICKVTVKKNDKIMRVTKADKISAKKIHNRLMKGKAVYILTNMKSKNKAKLFIKKLSKKIGEYNACAIGIDIDDLTNRYHNHMKGVKKKEKNYYNFKLDSYDAKGYKSAISEVKKWFAEAKRVNNEAFTSRNDFVAKKREALREVYATDTSNYMDIFKKVTGIPYKEMKHDGWSEFSDYNYLDGQIAKSKTLSCYTEFEWKHKNPVSDDAYTLPGDYYYITYKDETGKTKYWSNDVVLLYMQYENAAEKGDYDNYSVLGCDLTGYLRCDDTPKLTDVTFHYEPLAVDLAGVQKEIDTEIENALKQELGVSDISAYTKKTDMESAIEKATKFCNLSQAQQVYYLIDTYCKYKGKKQEWKITKICEYLGTHCYDNQIQVTNSKGQKAYLKFDSDMEECSTNGYTYSASGKSKIIKNFVN